MLDAGRFFGGFQKDAETKTIDRTIKKVSGDDEYSDGTIKIALRQCLAISISIVFKCYT